MPVFSHRAVPQFAALFLLTLPCGLAAQQGLGSPADLTVGVLVRFREDGHWTKGTITSATGDSLTVATSADTQTVVLAELQELSFSLGKKPKIVEGILLGALGGALGAGTAFLIEYAMMESVWGGGPVESSGGWSSVGVGALAGGAVGALLAVAMPAERWVAVQVPVQPIVAPTPNGVAIGMRLRF
jgi:hypothetical protein